MGFISAAMGIVSLIGGAKAKSDAEAAGRSQARMENRITDEKLYNLGQEERQLAGTTRATAAGSGVKADTGSPLTILAEQARTFARERRFTSEVGAEKASLAKQRGQMAGQQAMYSGISGALSAFGQAGTSTAKTGSFFKFG